MRRTATAATPAKARVDADGGTLLVGAALVTVTVGAWAAVLARAATSSGGMAIDTSTPAGPDLSGATGFVGTWVVMMAAMMLPSAAPLVLLYRGTGADGRAVNAVPLVAAYLLVWAAFGALVYAAQQALGAVTNASSALGDARPYAVAGILAIAGLYQFTFLKRACLRKCRSPLDFVMHHWRGRGPFDALRLGIEHGTYCVGCCWGLMAVLVISGAMSLLWVVLIALIVFMEKVMPFGERSAQLSGAGLGLLAVLVALHPPLSMLLRGGGAGM
jgi:predicted metal-binding membrane protein